MSEYPKKTYFPFRGQSKYASRWWLGITDENGNYEAKSFPYKRERTEYIAKLKAEGYTKIETSISE